MSILYPQEDRDAGDVYVKSAYDWDSDYFVVKVSPWFRINAEKNAPQGGLFIVVDSRTGHTRAIFNEEHYLSDIRTAAAGALAARYLAPQNVHTACVVGTGTQALLQAQALFSERKFKRLYVWGRDCLKVRRIAKRIGEALPGVAVLAAASLESAVKDAEVIVTTTSSKEPLICGAWLCDGQHVTAIGADDPSKCELDRECLERAQLITVDSLLDGAANGELYRHQWPLDSNKVVEIGHVLVGRKRGRSTPKEITIAKFVGLGVQDLAAANEVLMRWEG